MNKTLLIGRLTRDADIRYSQGEHPIATARFTLAIDRKYKKDGGEQTADFIPCVAFRKTAEIVEKYCRQGTKIAVDGRIQSGSYTDKDGNKKYTLDVVVESLEFCESKNSESGSSPANGTYSDGDGFVPIPNGLEEELPFS